VKVDPSPFRVVRVPRKVLVRYVPAIEDAVATPLRAQSEAVRLLSGYLGLIESLPPLASAEALHLAATHIHDLVGLALGARGDAARLAADRGLGAARLRAAKAAVLAGLGNQHLSVGAVAAKLGISARYLQMLFDRDGTTFSEYLLERRLVHVHKILCGPRRSAFGIAELAFETGFGSLAHFNRAFRRRYGATPSDIRAQAGSS
jgi:AraC-like DNA-binding protein